MKNGKKPTRREWNYIRQYNLNPDNWLISKKAEGYMHLVHRLTNSTRKLPLE